MTQKTKATLTTEITTNFPDNSTGSITASLMRSTTQDFVDSWADLVSVGALAVKISAVNFNSGNTDNAITIPALPTGYTRYKIIDCVITGASQTLTTATCGLFTTTGAGGTAIVTSATAITVATATESTNNNMQSLTINNTATLSYTNATLQFRVQTAQGAAATANVTLFIRPVS